MANCVWTTFINRPPLALAASTIVLCAIGLIALDFRIQLYELKDPDVETHWTQLLLELSKLDFCVSNYTGAKTMSESLAAAESFSGKLVSSFGSEPDQMTHSVEQHVLLYPTGNLLKATSYAMTANMRGRHIGIKGGLALQPFNVTFELKLDSRLQHKDPVRLISCVRLTSSKEILPQRTLRGACSANRVFTRDTSDVQYARLEWTKRTDLFGSNRCDGRVRLRTDFLISDELLPVLKGKDITLISFHLRVIVVALFGILFGSMIIGTLFMDSRPPPSPVSHTGMTKL